jgi:hypothetical protein
VVAWPKWIEDAAQDEIRENSGIALENLGKRLDELGISAGDISDEGGAVVCGPFRHTINNDRTLAALFGLLSDIEKNRQAVEAERDRAKRIGEAARGWDTWGAEVEDAIKRKHRPRDLSARQMRELGAKAGVIVVRLGRHGLSPERLSPRTELGSRAWLRSSRLRGFPCSL